MPRPSIGDTAMTEAERQACPGEGGGPLPCHARGRPVGAAGSSAGTTRSSNSRRHRLSMPPGWRHGRTINKTAPRRRRSAVCDIDLAELQAIEPPHGFGRD
jgi:hypothetical protein